VIAISAPPANPSESRRRRAKRSIARRIEKYVVNPLLRAALTRGLAPSAYALLETTGRRTGRIRRIPVANGLDGDSFWLISAHRCHSHYVHNIQAHPRVRIGLRAGRALCWRSGTAYPMPDDDARARQRRLGRGMLAYRLDALLLRALATDLQTIRIDLDQRRHR
jgi:deazaflavin-dependent oxidoreductase (nitroreductase family)